MMNQNQPIIPVSRNPIFGSHSLQNFSLPSSFIHYIALNSNCQKLFQTCKYFYPKYPIIAVDHLRFSSLSSKWRVVDPDHINDSLYEFDLSELIYKLWITDKFDIFIHNGYQPNVASELCHKKLFRCDVAELLIQDQIISYNEFLVLTDSKKLSDVRFEKTIVKNSDGSLVHPEIIFARCKNVKDFIYEYPDNSEISQTTAKAITELPRFENLKIFNFRNIPEGFDFEIFTNKFVNNHPKTRCHLSFSKNLSDSYITKLNKHVENIIQSHETPPSHFGFPGQNKGTYETLWIMQNEYFPSIFDD